MADFSKNLSGFGIVRTILGVVLLAAAILKGHQLATAPVPEVGLLTSRWFLAAVVEFEFIFALWLLAGIYPRLTWAAALTCFGLLSGVALSKGLAGEASCGCFGLVPVSPWYTLAFDLAAITGLCFFRPKGLTASPESQPPMLKQPSRRVAVVLAIVFVVGIPAGVAMQTFTPASITQAGQIVGDSRFVILEPEKWVGKPFPLFDHIDVGKQLATGNWTLVLYHYDCPECQELIRKCEGDPRVALIEMPPYGPLPTGVISDNPKCTFGKLSEAWDWFVSAPVMLDIENGQTKQLIDSHKDSQLSTLWP